MCLPPDDRSSSPWATALRWRREAVAVSDAALRVNLHHLAQGAWLMVVLNLGHVAYFGFWLDEAQAGRSAWAREVAWAHALMVGPMLAVWGTARWARHRIRLPWPARFLPEWTAVGVLVWAIHLTWVDQAVGSAISAYINACAALAILLLIQPWRALVLYALAWGVLVWGLAEGAEGSPALASARVNAATVSLLSLLVSVLLWRRFVQTELLQRALADTNSRLERHQVQLETLATTDALTGLLNRRALWDRARVELARAQREHTPLSLLVLDLDHFKQVNDRWGHLAGDAVLHHVAGLMQGTVRRTDVVGRLGGEEFVVLLPQAGAEAAAHLADKLRRSVETSPTPWPASVGSGVVNPPPELPVTVSIGGASLSPGAQGSLELLLGLADQALYRAKAEGRNRVVWSAEAVAGPPLSESKNHDAS